MHCSEGGLNPVRSDAPPKPLLTKISEPPLSSQFTALSESHTFKTDDFIFARP